jgi:hypothetical protein
MGIWLRRGRGQSKHRNEPSYSVKSAWYLDQLRHYKMLEKKLFYPVHTTRTQSNTTQVYFNSISYTYVCPVCSACTYIRSKRDWKSVLLNKIMSLFYITQISRRLLMQLRVTRLHDLKKMCLMSKILS